jgi:RNA polymerase sigma-70 factor, ECF subfamily
MGGDAKQKCPEADLATIHRLCDQAANNLVALEQLLWVYHARLLSYARRKIGPEWRGRIEPEDVLQEAYLEVFGTIARFTWTGQDSFYRWVARIVHLRFIDHVRRLRRKKRGGHACRLEPAGSASRHDLLLGRCLAKTPSSVVGRQEALAAMMTSMAQLPEHYRTVIQRVYLNEDPVATVAADLGRSEKAVRHLAARAVRRLGHHLGRASDFFGS